MIKHIDIPEGAEEWLVNLIELKNRTDITLKQIAERENLAEKSVQNVFVGNSKSPGVDLVRRIIHALGGSWTEIFAESGAVIGAQDIAKLQEENAALKACIDGLKLDLSVAERRLAAVCAENEILKVKLDYESKMASIHDLYAKLLRKYSDEEDTLWN